LAKKKRKEKPFDPEVDTGILRPVRARIAAGDVNDKYSTYPSNGLTPKKLARILRAADAGDVSEQMELFEEMEEKDTHLFSQLQTRKLAVTGLDWEVQPFGDTELDKLVADFISGQLRGIENLDDVFLDMLDAIGKGVSVMEIAWGVSPEGWNIIEDIEYIHPKKLVWDSLTDEMLICTREFPSGISLPENKFAVHRYKAKSGHTSRNGILRVCAWMYLFKNYDVKDWVAFCEVFGMPLRLGKYSAAASEQDKKALMEAIYSLGSDAAGIVPDTTVIEFIESQKTTSVEIYEQLARYCDEQVSKAVLGQTLTSDSGGGSYAQSKTHNEVRHDLTVADAKALATTVRRDIIRPLVEYNFGKDVDIPFFMFDCREAEDQKETVDIYRTLVCDMGLKIPESHIYKKFNIPKPEEGEEVLHPRLVMETRLPQEGPDGTEEQSLKDDTGQAEQDQIDAMAAEAVKRAEDAFHEMMKPILSKIDTADDLETLRETLKDEDEIKKLYEQMDSPELEDILHQAIYLSELIGRSQQ
jgi:phage gp29-like protein